MLEKIEEFSKYVGITGFRNVKISDVDAFLDNVRKEKPFDVEIQFFDAKHIATWQHLYFAVLNSLTAFKNKKNISKSLSMETMLYASAQHQIRKAMEALKIKPNSSEIAVVVIAEKPETAKASLSIVSKLVNARQDETVLGLNDKKVDAVKKFFDISDIELKTVMEKGRLEKALTDLVIERVALLATQN